MKIGILTMHLSLAACGSLKEKRSRIKPLVTRLHKEFNVSVCELDFQDVWQTAMIGCALINTDSRVIQQTFGKIISFTESFFTAVELVDQKIEIL